MLVDKREHSYAAAKDKYSPKERRVDVYTVVAAINNNEMTSWDMGIGDSEAKTGRDIKCEKILDQLVICTGDLGMREMHMLSSCSIQIQSKI